MKRSLIFPTLVLLTSLACAVPVSTTVPAARPSATTVLSATPTTVPSAVTTPASGSTTVDVIAFEALHVRAAPDYKSEVVDYLFVGEEVELTGRCSTNPKGWAQIKWNGSTAWVRAKYLSANKCKE